MFVNRWIIKLFCDIVWRYELLFFITKVDKDSTAAKKRQARKFKDGLAKNEEITREYYIHMRLPEPSEHTEHSLNQVKTDSFWII